MHNVTSLTEFRAARTAAAGAPPWSKDILACAAYAKMVRAEHDAEKARIDYECVLRGNICFWDADDLRGRADANNLEWMRYIGLLQHIATLPAADRRLATIKRSVIGRLWLTAEGALFETMRKGCEGDDHFFPKSARLRRV